MNIEPFYPYSSDTSMTISEEWLILAIIVYKYFLHHSLCQHELVIIHYEYTIITKTKNKKYNTISKFADFRLKAG
jgi:hypothetical protein